MISRITMVREDQVKKALALLSSASDNLNRWSCFSASDLRAIKIIFERYGDRFHEAWSSTYEVFVEEINNELRRQAVESALVDNHNVLEDKKEYLFR